jgi:arginine decarboxylase
MRHSPKKLWKLGREEFNTQFFDINKKHELVVKEGWYQYNIHDLVRKYGSPLHILFPSIIEHRVRKLTDAFTWNIRHNSYRGKFYYHFPMKVNQSREAVLPIIAEGANAETSSSNELWVIKRLCEEGRFNSRLRILCNGPKTLPYLKLIEELQGKGVSVTPVIEERREMDFFRKYRGEVGIRANLNIKIRSHWDKKFNRFGFQEDELLEMGRIRNLGVLSYHISSQIDYVDGLVEPIRRTMLLYAKLREKNPQLDTVNIGGGAGIPYEKRRYYSIRSAVGRIVRTFKKAALALGVREPNIICEWGRYVVAPAQMTIFKVFAEKTVTNGSTKRWYSVDGSFFNDLPDTLLVHQKWHIVPVNEMSSRPLQKVWLAGMSCDSDDRYTAGGGHILLPKLREDDGDDQYLAALDTGAYQEPLASHHCLLSHPAKIVARDGDIKLVREHQTPEEVGREFGW